RAGRVARARRPGRGGQSRRYRAGAHGNDGFPRLQRLPRILWHASFPPSVTRIEGKSMNHASRRIAAAVFLLTSLTTLAMAKTSRVYIATQNPEKMGVTMAEFD